MKRKRFRNREEFHSEIERRWLKTARPPSRTSGAIATIIFVIVLAALLVAAYRNRARIGVLWQQMTGKTPPVWLMPEKPKHGEIRVDDTHLCGTARTSPLPSAQASAPSGRESPVPGSLLAVGDTRRARTNHGALAGLGAVRALD